MKKKRTKRRHPRHIMMYGAAISICVILLFFVITGTLIGHEVKSRCRVATHKYGGDCVEALMSQLADENQGYRARNDAVWALGQIGDDRALPILQTYYDGNIPNREPHDKSISQYELKKAINLTKGGLNISACIWRWGYEK